jgi:hypothetical protein
MPAVIKPAASDLNGSLFGRPKRRAIPETTIMLSTKYRTKV